jgi:signal transduction histidine kinase
VTLELGEVTAAWPWGASLALAALARGLGLGRRRAALNEALHELRRPLQTLALTVPSGRAGAESSLEGSLQLARTALERLDREINGEPATPRPAPVFLGSLLASAVSRWRPQALLAGGSLRLDRDGSEPVVLGDRWRLAQAVDNLLANALAHGGPAIVVAVAAGGGRVEIAVRDRGRDRRAGGRAPRPRQLADRLSGRRRHGHGLRVVRRVVREHGGGFELRRGRDGAEAVLELPLHSLRGPAR